MRNVICGLCLFAVGCSQGPNYPLPGPSPVPTPQPTTPPAIAQTALRVEPHVSPTPLYAGEPANFNAIVAPVVPTSPAAFVWTFGDGQSLAVSRGDAAHVYRAPGLYTAHVTLTDGDARTAEADVVVSVDLRPVVVPPLPPTPLPVPGFEPSLACTAGAPGATTACNITASYRGIVLPSANITSVAWDYGDGQIATTTVPVSAHTYPAGSFTVFATVTGNTSDGAQVATVQQSLTIK